jgi:Mg-chelatase subunit ChlD
MLNLICGKLSLIFLSVTFIMISVVAIAQEAEKVETNPGKQKPITEENRIDLVFVLDSTGSMGGLIEGAKAKIWSIANSMITLPSKPKIRIGLLTYRDRGDEYVTKLFDLTEDIDKTFANLTSFRANGGGDRPESVNQALDEAVNKMSWDKTNPKVYKVIFLVGDCPPHMNYQDDVKYPVTCSKAAENGIMINTIQCGTDSSCEPIWRDIAQKSDGEYIRISQTGDVQVIQTPFDAELAKLTDEINTTVLAYGSKKEKIIVASKMAFSKNADISVQAQRAEFNKNSGGLAIQGAGDLIADIDNSKVKLDSITKDELPDELKDKSKEEQEKYLAELSQKRKEVNEKIADLTKKRMEWLNEEKKKNSNKTDKSFDGQLQKIVEKQSSQIFNRSK